MTNKYPEHEKLRTRQTEASTLSSFIDFIAEQGWELAKFSTTETSGCGRFINDRMKSSACFWRSIR